MRGTSETLSLFITQVMKTQSRELKGFAKCFTDITRWTIHVLDTTLSYIGLLHETHSEIRLLI